MKILELEMNYKRFHIYSKVFRTLNIYFWFKKNFVNDPTIKKVLVVVFSIIEVKIYVDNLSHFVLKSPVNCVWSIQDYVF